MAPSQATDRDEEVDAVNTDGSKYMDTGRPCGAREEATELSARVGRKSEMRGIKMATPMRTRKYTRAATTDSKSGKLASNFGKLLENDFCMFCQILKDGKSFTKLLEML